MFEPLILGWHKGRADFLLDYAFYTTLGSYSSDSLNNAGLGFFETQVQVGTTVHLDKAKTLDLSLLSTWEFNQTKSGIDNRPGKMLTLEYAIGKHALRGALTVGASGHYFRKLTADSGSDVPALARGVHGQAMGLGPELQLALPIPPVFAQLMIRYQPQFNVEARPSGQIIVASLTLMNLFLHK